MSVTDSQSDQVVETLRSRLRGQLITRADASYDDARRVYNGAIDRHPWAVAQVADESGARAAR